MLQVPASRADIFQNTDLSPVSKRSLMRFLKNTLEALEGKGALKASLCALSSEQTFFELPPPSAALASWSGLL